MRNRTHSIQRFFFGHYFSDGIRITLGVLLPALIFAQINQFEIGVTISLGALSVSVADNPGPLVHKRNGMLFCNLFIFVIALLMGFLNGHPVLVGITITILSFFFSMFNVYGNRASSIGTAVLVVMVLSMDKKLPPAEVLKNAGLIVSGGIWYMLLSLSSFQILPYRPAQQTLGDCIIQVARFMRIKARFYRTNTNFDEEYRHLVDQQVIVNQEQDNVREMLFKSRLMIKESTRMGRILVLTFVDVVDLFEQIMATHYDYVSIHARFKDTGIMPKLEKAILNLADELDSIGLAILSNSRFHSRFNGQEMLENLKTTVDGIGNNSTLQSNIVLRKILVNVRNINQRITAIQSYFDTKNLQKGPLDEQLELTRFVSHQDYDWRIFRNNLNWKSATFRHASRVALVALTGFLISKMFTYGHHSYWILLTILVVLKPGFSLSKQRSYQRLIGTVAGGAIGLLILYFIKDTTAQFILLLIFMVGTYSFQRINYITSVVFMTPYILILFNFLGAGSTDIVQARILDTLIGSGIAFLAIYTIFPNWEGEQVKQNMGEVLKANGHYLFVLAELLTGKQVTGSDYRVARKDVYVSSANLAAAFQRMLSEPKSKQRETKEVQKFVVLNHILSSYIANMAMGLLSRESGSISPPEQNKTLKKAIVTLDEATKKMDQTYEPIVFKSDTGTISGQVNEDKSEVQLMQEQVDFIAKISVDIARITDNLAA